MRCPHGFNSDPKRCSQCLGVKVPRLPIVETEYKPTKRMRRPTRANWSKWDARNQKQ